MSRIVEDVDGDGLGDIVAFGNRATYYSLSTGTSFAGISVWLAGFGPSAGGWSGYDRYPRMVGDVNGDGRADAVGCGEVASFVALSNQ